MACHHDDDAVGLPPRSATVPNTSADPLPLPIYEEREASADPVLPQTALTVAVDVDPALSADSWFVKASILGVVRRVQSLEFQDHQAELTLPWTGEPDVDVRIEVYGRTKLSDGTDYILGHRIATTRFVPTQHRLAYVFIDSQCAYSGTSDGGRTCANEHEWCSEGTCRPEELPATALDAYRSNWREKPPSPCPSGAPSLELGEGLLAFAERKDGDTVTIECGSQGGHHIWIAARTKGIDQRAPIVTVTSPASDAGAALITSYPLARLYAAEGDAGAPGACEANGVQFQLDPDGRPVQGYLGQPIDITLAVADKNGQKAQVTRHLQVASKLSATSCFSP